MPPLRLPKPSSGRLHALRPARPRSCSLHTSSARRSSSPLFNIAGLAASRESQFFSKERGIPRSEFSPTVQLIRSSEVDPFAPAPGASADAIRQACIRAEDGSSAFGDGESAPAEVDEPGMRRADTAEALLAETIHHRGAAEAAYPRGQSSEILLRELEAARVEVSELRRLSGRGGGSGSSPGEGRLLWALFGATLAWAALVPLRRDDIRQHAERYAEWIRKGLIGDGAAAAAVDADEEPVFAVGGTAAVPVIEEVLPRPTPRETPVSERSWRQLLSRLFWAST